MPPQPSGVEPFTFPQLDPTAFTDSTQRTAVERLNAQLRQWHTLLNGGVSLGDKLDAHAGHISGEILNVTVLAFGSDFAWSHNLGRVPTGVIELISEGSTNLYRVAATPPDTTTLVWFRSAEAIGTRCKVLVF